MSFDYGSVGETDQSYEPTVSALDKQIADLKAQRKLLRNREFAVISNLEDKLFGLAAVLNVTNPHVEDLDTLFDEIIKKARELMTTPHPRPPAMRQRGGAAGIPHWEETLPMNDLATQRDGAEPRIY